MFKQKFLFPVVVAACLSTPVLADSLNSQIAAVAAAEQEGKQAEARARDQAAAQARARQNAAAKKQAALAAKKAAQEEKAYTEYLQDKKRDQSFEDELRQLELEERKLELAKRKARLNREDDFIEQELKREAAKTDSIQSDADAKRSIARGAESLLTQEGEARVKKESGFFK